LQFGGYGANIQQLKLPAGKAAEFNHQFNSFHFEFASPMFGQLANIEYSYYLQGFDANWIDFNKKTEKDYTNLPPGNYVFKVKARNNLGNESAISEYAFVVLPPWYQTTVAYVIYILLAAFGTWLLYRFLRRKFIAQQQRHEEEQRRLQYLHQLEMDKAEKELVQLRNEKLEAEIVNKNSELATTAMHLVQKSDVLLKIKEQMIKLKNTPATAENATDLKKILKTLNEENKMEEQWQQFSLHFDKVHSDFLVTLKTRYPKLSNSEMKLCAYLRMNLSTKEMAQLMNISVRGVEISRYRLRKKLQIPTETNLFDFLMQATTTPVE
jgi:DNA-binding CsgD family transcriptional regulator